MILFVKLFLAHLFGDFVFQPTSWVEDKKKKKIRSIALYKHLFVHFIALSLVLQFQYTKYWLSIVVIVVSHFAIDVIKSYFQKKELFRIYFFVDQVLHVLVLFIVVLMQASVTISLNHFLAPNIFALITCIVFLVFASPVIIRIFIAKWAPIQKNDKKDSLKEAGKFIGIIERLFIFIFVVYGHWEAIGFLLAAKSIFRFGDLTNAKDRKLTEYIVIGTFTSFGIALLTGLAYLELVQF